MSRSITVSTEVFAAIWARRQEGEESEDDILRRVLNCPHFEERAAPSTNRSQHGSGGVFDSRNNVRFSEGFEIFRIYKGKKYRAQARAGMWFRLDNGERYPTLNQLNTSIAAGPENVWNGSWRYRTADGAEHSIAELRRA